MDNAGEFSNRFRKLIRPVRHALNVSRPCYVAVRLFSCGEKHQIRPAKLRIRDIRVIRLLELMILRASRIARGCGWFAIAWIFFSLPFFLHLPCSNAGELICPTASKLV